MASNPKMRTMRVFFFLKKKKCRLGTSQEEFLFCILFTAEHDIFMLGFSALVDSLDHYTYFDIYALVSATNA
jgi:hypothetical protein